MKSLFFVLALVIGMIGICRATDITTLDGRTYVGVKDIAVKHSGLFFVYGTGDSLHGVTIPFTNLTAEIKDQYHCDPFSLGLAYARQDFTVNLNKKMAFSLGQLDAAEKKAKAEKKLIGFIMEWDSMLVPAQPLDRGSDSGLAHFYDVFNDGMVLVFVRHETELNNVPDAVRQGFFGPEEGGFAPNMAVVSDDCSQFVCEIPYGGDKSNGAIREQIFRQKIAVIKQFLHDHPEAVQ